MSVNTLTRKLNALLTTTLEKYRDTMADNIFRSNVVLNQMMENGNVIRQGGGNEIVSPLMYAENDTVMSYSGYDQLDTSPQDGISAAEYQWKQYAATVAISRKERRMNSGEEALFNLLDKKVQQAEMSIQQRINDDLINSFQPGNGGKDLTPIPQIVAKDPTSAPADVLGEIDANDNSFWRNHSEDSAATTTDDLEEEMLDIYNRARRGGMNTKPDLLVGDQRTFENYEAGLDKSQRYVDTDMADFGFQNLRFKSSTFVWDETVPDVANDAEFNEQNDYEPGTNPATGTIFFLTTEHLEFIIDSETEFESTEFIEPEDQDAAVSKILFMGELTTNNRRKHGILYNIDHDLSRA